MHAHLTDGVVKSLRHASNVVVGAVGRTFLAKEPLLICHSAWYHTHFVFNVTLGL